MKTNNIIIAGLILSVFLVLPLSSASLGTFEKGDCVGIRVLANCTYVNLTEVTANQNTTFIINKPMTKLGGQTFNYTFCNTSELGKYTYSWNNPCVDCSNGDCGNEFEISYTGNDRVNSGEGMIIVITLIVLIIVGLIFILIGSKSSSQIIKIILIGTGGIIMIAGVLYSLVILTQTLSNYSAITEGYATFWMIVKIIIGILILALLIFSMFLAFRFWKYKRGLRD